jgi:hypothetical protein
MRLRVMCLLLRREEVFVYKNWWTEVVREGWVFCIAGGCWLFVKFGV